MIAPLVKLLEQEQLLCRAAMSDFTQPPLPHDHTRRHFGIARGPATFAT